MTKKALGTRVNCGSFSLDLCNVLGKLACLSSACSRGLSCSLSLPARSLWRALGRAGEEVLEMRKKCEENVKEEEEEEEW